MVRWLGIRRRCACSLLFLQFSYFAEISAHVVVPDGYGLSYGIGADHIRWTITSLKRRGDELKHYLQEAATEVKAMMERAAKEKEAQVPKAKL